MSFVDCQKRWSKVLLLLIAGVSVLFTSCSRADKQTAETIAETYLTTPPFSTKEPDKYKAIRKLTVTDSDGTSKSLQTEIARSGELRREATETSSQPIVYLDSTDGSFILLPRDKVYANTNEETKRPSETDPTDPERRVRTEPVKVKYQKLGSEVVGDRNLAKYRVVNISNDGTVSTGETFIWVDESLGIPVRSDSKSDHGRTLMELTDISLEFDKSLFEIPVDYQKIAITELRRRIQKD